MTTRPVHASRSVAVSCLTLVGMCLTGASEAATIRVPADVVGIQRAIDAAANGDTVLVSPGTYYERINFRGKAITLTSEQGPDVTTIDGQRGGTVVTFLSREGRESVLTGFTITGGFNASAGGGIHIGSSSPTIRGNTITRNAGCSGAGIQSNSGAPRIEHNRVIGNAVEACTGAWGIGIYILGRAADSAAELFDNDISENRSIGSSFGGGVALVGAGAAVLRRNVISHNVTDGPSGCGQGGGLISSNFTQATLVDNLIVHNTACFGGGIYWGGILGASVWTNNTVADNDALNFPGVYVSGFAWNDFYNNLITATSGPALYCEFTQMPPVLRANDVFRSGGAAYGGSCLDQTGLNGNISAAPLFVDAADRDYRLTMASAAIDAGTDAAAQLPSTDLEGYPRVVDGNGDGIVHVDIGALEYRNRAPVVSAGGDRVVAIAGACLADVTLTGTGSDPDGDPVTLVWTSSLGTVTGATLSVVLPAGTYVFTLTATDGSGASTSDTALVYVVDVTPPVIGATTANPSVLSPANHKMVPVVVTAAASDQCGGSVSCRIVSVTSNEPENGSGDGNTNHDWEITGDLTLNVRAERAGSGTGRVYTITVACTDSSGNQSTSSLTVTVPRNY